MNRFVLVPVDPPPDDISCWPPLRPARRLDVERLIGPLAWRRLPMPVRRRFAVDHGDAQYHGSIDLDCSPVGRVFALLARLVGGPLTSMRATALRATVTVSDNGHGGVVWARRFENGDGTTPTVVRSTKQLAANGTLIEQTDGGLAMQLDVFEQQGALVFQSRHYFLKAGPLRIAIPGLLTPGVCRVEHHDLGGGRFRFILNMTHPIWGVTFSQDGVFQDPERKSNHE